MKFHALYKMMILLGLGLSPNLGSAEIQPTLNLMDKSLTYILDKGLAYTGYRFEEVFLRLKSDPEHPLGPLSMGQAMIFNEKIHRDVGVNEFAASISFHAKFKGSPIGELSLHWHPSQSFLSLAAGFLLYRFDRAYIWPQFLLSNFPGWFVPEPKHEPFEFQWQHADLLLKVEKLKPELQIFANLLREMQDLNPQVDEFSAKGFVNYFGLAKNNKTVFIIQVTSEFPGALRCQQELRTDYNPFTNDLSHAKGKLS
ncbi:MAG: hypothetical protein ACXVB4_07570, partial [Pseudobdellovibrionaceae bacterium]